MFTFTKALLSLLVVATEHQESFLIFYYCFCLVSKGALSLIYIIKHVPLQRLANWSAEPHTSLHISCSLRAKQPWPLVNPLNDPTSMHICYLNIHRSASVAWAWEPLLCYQKVDPVLESPQAPTCSLPTPWAPLPKTHTPELTTLGSWFVCFFQAQFAF